MSFGAPKFILNIGGSSFETPLHVICPVIRGAFSIVVDGNIGGVYFLAIGKVVVLPKYSR